jgi:hypothetical protein
MVKAGTLVQNRVQNRGKTGCKTSAALVQNRVQNRRKTGVNGVPPYPYGGFILPRVGYNQGRKRQKPSPLFAGLGLNLAPSAAPVALTHRRAGPPRATPDASSPIAAALCLISVKSPTTQTGE